jgi:LPXTG-motif cell wall-anchored protein
MLILFMLCISVFLPGFSYVVCVEREYTYYGVIPSKICQYVLNDTQRPELGYIFEQDVDTRRTKILVSVTATEGNTDVNVFYLNNGSLVSQAHLDALEKLFVLFPVGSMFKVVTSKYTSVMILNFPDVPPAIVPNVRDPMPNTFQASVNGTYVGKEFVFMASWNAGAGQFQPYRVFGVEKANVKVTSENGTVQNYSVDVNSYKDIAVDAYVSYRVESSGNIMIQAKENMGRGAQRFYYFVPSAEGGFVGRVFYTTSTTDWDSTEDYGFRISAVQDSAGTIWNLKDQVKIMDFAVKGGEGIRVQPKAEAIMIQCSKPVTVEWLANGSTTRRTGGDAYGSGIAYLGVKAGEDAMFLLSTNATNEAYIFAYERTAVNLDGHVVNVDAGSYSLLMEPGVHEVVPDKNVVIEVISWPLYPSFQGLNFGGVEIPCVQLVDVVPNVTITPFAETSLTMYIIIGAAVAGLAAGLGFFFMKRRKK